MILETYPFLPGCLFFGHVTDFFLIHWSIVNLQCVLSSAVEQSELVTDIHKSGFADGTNGKEQETQETWA